jgi:hypothetical protein
MMIGFSDGKLSQYQRIHELLLTHYPLQEDKWNFIASATHEQALVDSKSVMHHEKWKQYIKSVKSRVKGTFRASPTSLPHLIPALEGLFTIKQEKSGAVVYKRKFRVFSSLIGNFYTMFGQDEVHVEAAAQSGIDN